MFKRIITSALLFGAAATAPPALAQQVACGPREKIVERLAGQFSEQLAGAGLQSERQYVEIWAAPEGGTFTVLVTRADGLSCIVAAGRHWHQRRLEVAEADRAS